VKQVAAIFSISTDKVIIPSGRVRKEFEPKSLKDLAEGYKRVGQCQPGVCLANPDGTVTLVAGERRLRAAVLANVEYRFTLREETDPLLIREIEIRENIDRVNLNWKEDVFAKDELHRVLEERKSRLGGSQSIRDTAKELGGSFGNLAEDLELARYAKAIPEVAEAKNKTDAKALIKKFKGAVLRETLLMAAKESAMESAARVDEAPERASITFSDDVPKPLQGDEKILEFDRRVLLGRMEEHLEQFHDESVHIFFWDPPWGERYDTFGKKNFEQEEYDDSKEYVLDNFPGWLDLIFQKSAADSHLYLKFGIRNFEYIYTQLERAGFSTNKMPIIWYKQGSHRTRNPDIWPGRAYEAIAFARKGNKPLVWKGAPDVILTQAPTPSMKDNHPSAMHPDLCLNILKRSAMPGDTVVDPMCGSGMLGVAADAMNITHKLDWWLIEEKTEFRSTAMLNLIKGYSTIVRAGTTADSFIAEKGSSVVPSGTFKDLFPGSNEWKDYWKTHPEEQNDILKWRKETGK